MILHIGLLLVSFLLYILAGCLITALAETLDNQEYSPPHRCLTILIWPVMLVIWAMLYTIFGSLYGIDAFVDFLKRHLFGKTY